MNGFKESRILLIKSFTEATKEKVDAKHQSCSEEAYILKELMDKKLKDKTKRKLWIIDCNIS